MKYKIGDKLKVKKGCEGKCGQYNDFTDPTHIQITEILPSRDSYNYTIYKGNEELSTCSVCFKDEHLEPLEKTWDTLEEGDILLDEDGDECEVLGICGRAILLERSGYFWTKEELIRDGYTIKNATPEPEQTEVTLQDIADWKGIPVEQLRIKE